MFVLNSLWIRYALSFVRSFSFCFRWVCIRSCSCYDAEYALHLFIVLLKRIVKLVLIIKRRKKKKRTLGHVHTQKFRLRIVNSYGFVKSLVHLTNFFYEL
jgi:hypothetical protein